MRALVEPYTGCRFNMQTFKLSKYFCVICRHVHKTIFNKRVTQISSLFIKHDLKSSRDRIFFPISTEKIICFLAFTGDDNQRRIQISVKHLT